MTFSVIPTFQTIKGSYLKESANVSEWTSRQDCFIAVLSCVVWHRVMESLNLLRYLVIRDKVTDNQVSRPANIRGDQKQQYWTMVWFTSFITLSAVLQTGIWTELYKIEDTFLKPLRVGVNMSRAHYERELHDTRATKRGKAKGQNTTRLFFFFFADRKTRMKASCQMMLRMTNLWMCFPQRSLWFLCPLEARSCRTWRQIPKFRLVTFTSAWRRWSCVCASPLADDLIGFLTCPFQALHSALHTFDMIESVLVRIEELTAGKENL